MLIAIVGALVISTSGPLVRLSDVSPATSALFRCAYAIPPMLILAWLERRRLGPLPRRALIPAWLAGGLFALDLLFWHHAIDYVGAGLATVLGNLQVFIVAFAAWALFKERPSTRLMVATPVVFAGVVLISGVFDSAAYGSDPVMGVLAGVATSIAYAAFLLLMKGGSDRAAGPLAHATVVATVMIAVLSPLFGGADFVPSWPAHGWLLVLALGPQVLGWSLITFSLPRQPAALTALLLLIQPMTTVALSAMALGERPSAWQLAGCAVIVLGVLYGSRRAQPLLAGAEEHEEQVPKTSTV
ncbi:drug/metabolite transporter (DMT)-like permease [Nonomuraea polychroma]|uniref:Drug/metabolite transporter (DMT)-like permease n=1 Tax=Nonomuraea polychroma TaxID=46176 RepID=A0A438LY50_9ACTN|nr:DMT family transporter [Nonomuraea polychroma]RVX38267.1 drug/metabolite transporter (DMT)-like permease [Nonomuraea polychroma]